MTADPRQEYCSGIQMLMRRKTNVLGCFLAFLGVTSGVALIAQYIHRLQYRNLKETTSVRSCSGV